MIKYLISAIVFILLDGIYLNLIKDYFSKQIQLVQGTPIKLKLTATAITYVFLIFGLNYFIISKKQSIQYAFLYGLVMYSVYELTNYSMFKSWSLLTVFMDSLWGGILYALTTAITYKLIKLI